MTAVDLQELGKLPISPDAPGGIPARDTPEFEILRKEIEKLEDADRPEVDWNLAVTSAETVLATQSKDLLAASYLCLALLERDGVAGLANGLGVLRDMVVTHWESLHPELKRARGRAAALSWLGERGGPSLSRARGATPELLEKSRVLVSEISEFLGPRLDSGAILLAELNRAIGAMATKVNRPPPPAPTQARESGQTGDASGGTLFDGSVRTAEDLDRALGDVRRLARTCAEFMRAQDPANPMAYRLARFGMWLPLKQAPPNKGGKTEIPPPPEDFVDGLKQAAASGQHPGVLEQAEGRLGTSVFWLDLHRYVVNALEAQGEGFRAAADAVVDEVASLLQRFPGLEELEFANGQPLADPETRRWLAQRVRASRGDGSSPAVEMEVSEDADEFEQGRAEAWKLVRARKVSQALARLEQGAARAGHLRERVRWRLEIARVCMEKGHTATALAQLEGLDRDLQNSTIEEWDPGLCAEVIRNLVLCRQKSSVTTNAPEEIVRSRELLGRLCRLDVVAALELNGKN